MNSGLPPVAVSRAAQKASSGSSPCSFCASTAIRLTAKRFGANRNKLRLGDELCDEHGIAALCLRRPGCGGDEHGDSSSLRVR